jgi:hypothetical protein
MGQVWDEAFAQAEDQGDEELLGVDVEDVPSDALLTLLHVGRLTKEVNSYGNTIVLRTLKSGEELELGVIIKKYADTPEEGRAFAVATVAASIESLNGKPLVNRLGPDDEDYLRRSFNIVRKWYWPVIEGLYEECVLLRKDQVAALQELRSK